MKDTAVVWLRNDLRLLDNPALTHAWRDHKSVLLLYIHDQNIGGEFKIGGASKWWLHHSLFSLSKEVNLTIRVGKAQDVLKDIIKETSANAVYWNRCYEPYSIKRDSEIKKSLQESGIKCESFNGSLLFEPWEIKTKVGDSYSVYTPFWKACLAKGIDRKPYTKPNLSKVITAKSESLETLSLLPKKPDWAGGLRDNWQPGEKNALKLLDDFIESSLNKYSDGRNFPSLNTTSRLSPHLRSNQSSMLLNGNLMQFL